MIAALTGVVAGFGSGGVELEVGGVGYYVNITSTMLGDLKLGQKVRIVTQLIVREDSMTVYGFTDAGQRDLFQMLTAVNGIGPKLALAVLSAFEPEALRRVVASADVESLRSVSGVGKRGAERIVVELKERLGVVVDGTGPSAARLAEVRDALAGLGYGPAELRPVLARLQADVGNVEDLVKAALKELSAA